MKIYFLGNCQTNALQGILKDVTPIRPAFGSITEFWGNHNLEDIERNLDAADVVVAMAVENPEHRYSADRLRARLGARLVLHPYVYVDGLASLEKISSKGQSVIRGAEHLQASDLWPDRIALIKSFTQGDIDMKQKERLSASLARISGAEDKFCDVGISDYLWETYTSRPSQYALNHPTQHVMFELFDRLMRHLDITPDPERRADPLIWAKRALPVNDRSLTPYDVSVHGLSYSADDHWYPRAIRLVQLAVIKSSE